LTRLIADEYERNRETFAALCQAAAWQKDISVLWKAKLDAEYWPEFEALGEPLERLAKLVADLSTDSQAGNMDATSTPILPSGQVPGANAASVLHEAIHNRRDAFRMLALVRHYFERHEPSHPAPLLIQRIEKLENLSFVDILSELTPDALAQLKQLAGEQLSP